MTESTTHPPSGLWKPTHLSTLHYGPSSVTNHLLASLPTPTSKAFIITGSSLSQKTPLIKDIENLLTPARHAGTFASIQQHAPVAQLDEATELVGKDEDEDGAGDAGQVDTLISVGGGSPIDAAKAIVYRVHEKSGKWLYHLAIPTTLSAAECTFFAGYTNSEGKKVLLSDPHLAPQTVIYDSSFAKYTPQRLWLSTGIRALDHAVELLYHPTAAEVPTKQLALSAIRELFTFLPKCRDAMDDDEVLTRAQLAAFGSLYPLGLNVKGGLGLSHSLGYALGAPYGVPHGITSCITLAGVVRLKSKNPGEAEQIARALECIGGGEATGDYETDAARVGDAIERLIGELELTTYLKDWGIGEGEFETIAKNGTGTTEGDVYEGVLGLLRSWKGDSSDKSG